MTGPGPVQLIHNQFELQDLIESQGGDPELIERDFALVTIAATLVSEFGDQLCFKGGFVLRHVYGHERFSKDVDVTKINPPKHKLEATVISEAISSAGARNLITLKPGVPTTDSAVGLSFDGIGYSGPLNKGTVSVELSYREDVVEPPEQVLVGPPYYEAFPIPAMTIFEMTAEKLRTLAQRTRPTDLADLAMILGAHDLDHQRVRELAQVKFKLVRPGDVEARIRTNVESIRRQYDAAIQAVAPDAPSFEDASSAVLRELTQLLP